MVAVGPPFRKIVFCAWVLGQEHSGEWRLVLSCVSVVHPRGVWKGPGALHDSRSGEHGISGGGEEGDRDLRGLCPTVLSALELSWVPRAGGNSPLGSQGPEIGSAERCHTVFSERKSIFIAHRVQAALLSRPPPAPLPWGSSIWILPAQLLKGPPPPHQFPTCPASHLGDAPASPSPSFSLSPLGSPFDWQG